MRALIVALVLAMAATAHAEPSSLGGFTLGQKLAKARPRKVTLFGCPGVITPQLKAKKVIAVVFDVDPEGPCGSGAEDFEAARDALRDAVSAEVGTRPVTNAQGDDLWAGTRASLVITPQYFDPDAMPPEIRLIAAGTRPPICWPGDGFAPFFAEFKAAVAAGKPADLARFLAFPFRDGTRSGASFATAKRFTAHPEALFTDSTREEIQREASPWCSYADQAYWFLLDDPRGLLTARRVAGTWRFVGLMPQPQD